MGSFIKYDMLPKENEEQVMAKRVYEFNRYLKSKCKVNSTTYKIDERAINFLNELGVYDKLVSDNNLMSASSWDKVYQKWMDIFREWLNGNKEQLLDKLNSIIFMDDWKKYAEGDMSKWEMYSLGFYYHDHELINVNRIKYGIRDFNNLPEEPIVEKTFTKGNKVINMYKLTKICGTCIAKNKAKGSVTLLTTTGVVNVRFRKEYFSIYDKQISKINGDGTKTVLEKSWFNKGNMIMVMGIRSGDDFIVKKYASSIGEQLYRIDGIKDNGLLVLRHERISGGIAEDVD